MAVKLTDKQEAFVREYLVDLNATAAARRAGYSEKNAGKIGPELLGKTRIQAALGNAMQKREARTEITADAVVKNLAKVVYSDIKDFLSFGQREINTGKVDAEGNPLYRTVNYVDFKDSSEVDGTLIQEVKQGRDGVSIKLMDKMKAMELLGRHLGMFNDKLEVSGQLVFFKGEDKLED